MLKFISQAWLSFWGFVFPPLTEEEERDAKQGWL